MPKFMLQVRVSFQTHHHHGLIIVSEQNGLREADIAVVRSLLYKLRHNLGARAFDEGRVALTTSPSQAVPPLRDSRRRLTGLAGFDALKFDCCFNSCVCYAPDEYRDLDKCPYCGDPRFDSAGKPRKQFSALPLIPVLLALVAAERPATDMGYRAAFKRDKGGVSDVFDGKLYRRMRKRHVNVNGAELPHKFFDGPRDVAIGFATDGFSPYRKKTITAWPIVLVNYNLPPKLRFRREHIICVGCIPGPNKPKNIDSFLWFLVMELLRLAHGVKANDGACGGRQFILQAYLILCTGDMPAVAMLMCMLGHNSVHSCRMCSIRGIRNPDRPRATTHYPALNRQRHPSKPTPAAYDAAHLPLRTHDNFLNQAQQVQLAAGPGERKQLAQDSGIKGVSVLSFLSSMSFPASFPFGFMHLMFENVVPGLVELWCHQLDPHLPDDDDFIIAPQVWKAVAEAGAASGKTIPSCFGAKVPNILTERHMFTAEKWLFWALYLAPTLLRGRFKKEKYYKHYMRLINLIKKCLQFRISSQELDEMEVGFIKWVTEYERSVTNIISLSFS
jgi:hypothetical protein